MAIEWNDAVGNLLEQVLCVFCARILGISLFNVHPIQLVKLISTGFIETNHSIIFG